MKTKRIAFITAVMMLVMSFPFISMATPTDEATYEAGKFIYKLHDSDQAGEPGTAEIIGYTGEKKENNKAGHSHIVTIPDKITVPDSGEAAEDQTEGTTYQVTAIGEKSFENNRSITQVEMPDTITTIGKNAFNCCTKLQTVILSNKMVNLGENAFFSCTRLLSVQIRTTEDSDGQSGEAASTDENTADKLSAKGIVTLPESLTKLGAGAFYDCSSIKEVCVQGDLDSVGDYAFGVCVQLEKAAFEGSVEKISDQMFLSCGTLKEIMFPDNLKTIGNHAFDRCFLLFDGTDLVIPESVESIGDYAFYYCCGMRGAQISNCTIGEGAFAYCTELSKVVFTEKGETSSSDTEPDIGARAFVYAPLEKIEIPAYVDEIEGGAFVSCGLYDITVHENNNSFESTDGVLMNEQKNELVAYPVGREDTSYSIPNGVTDVGMGAFAGNETLENVIFPGGLKCIGEAAFEGCCSLTSASIPDTVTEIGGNTFYGCESLEQADLPDGLETISKNLFGGCQYLESVTIPDSVQTIEEGAFASCFSLSSLNIPAKTSSISPLAFSYCGNLEKLDIAAGNTAFSMEDGVLYNKTGEKLLLCMPGKTGDSFTVPEKTTAIGTNAFSTNMNIRNVTVLKSVTNIEKNALGFMATSGSGPDDKAAEFYINNASGNATVKKYAEDNSIAYFTGAPSANKESVSLKAGETFTFTVKNAPKGNLLFTSSDESIAEVDRRTGKITGISKGETYITACSGTMTFICKVTVTTGTKPEVSGTKYNLYTTGSIPEWEGRYNNYNRSVSFDKLDNSNLLEYSSNNYIAILAHTQGGKYIEYADSTFGEKGYEQYKNVAGNLSLEMERYKQNENMVVFRGTSDTSQYTTARTSELEDMYDSIGSTVRTGNRDGEERYPGDWVASTSVDRNVSLLFASDSSTATMLEIYAPKDYLKGAYLNSFAIFDEAEILLDGGTEFEVIDAGVRVIELPMYEEDEEPWLKLERYMKLQITAVKGQKVPGLKDPVVVAVDEDGGVPEPKLYDIIIDREKLTITKDLSETEDFNTEEKIKRALYNRLMEILGSDGFKMENTVIWDIKAVDKEGNVVPATKLPSSGIKIVIPYPQQVEKDWEDYDFTILHMFAENRGARASAGGIEGPLPYTKTEEGLEVTASCVSPFAIHWSEKDTAKEDTGTENEDKSDVSNDEKDVADDDKNGGEGSDTDTGDTANMTPWIVTMLLTAAAIIALLGVMFRGRRTE